MYKIHLVYASSCKAAGKDGFTAYICWLTRSFLTKNLERILLGTRICCGKIIREEGLVVNSCWLLNPFLAVSFIKSKAPLPSVFKLPRTTYTCAHVHIMYTRTHALRLHTCASASPLEKSKWIETLTSSVHNPAVRLAVLEVAVFLHTEAKGARKAWLVSTVVKAV